MYIYRPLGTAQAARYMRACIQRVQCGHGSLTSTGTYFAGRMHLTPLGHQRFSLTLDGDRYQTAREVIGRLEDGLRTLDCHQASWMPNIRTLKASRTPESAWGSTKGYIELSHICCIWQSPCRWIITFSDCWKNSMSDNKKRVMVNFSNFSTSNL